MGWKALKEAFEIKHILQVEDKGVCIGSGYVHDLLTINPNTGEVHENTTFYKFGWESYPKLMEAKPSDIVKLLEKPDTFTASIPVYTWEGSTIVERKCEELGYPNVTHDGHVMYENTYSADIEQVKKWAKEDAELAVKFSIEWVDRLEADLAEAHDRLKKDQETLVKINSNSWGKELN